MTAKEFRIGNHVTVWNPKHRPEQNGRMMKVVGIKEEAVTLYDDQTPWDSGFGQLMKYIAPIYLSVDYLISVGFKEVKARSGIAAAYKKGSIRINRSNSGNFYFGKTSIPYVHRLENLYYDIEGKELTIKIEKQDEQSNISTKR